jgi:hypothetical protein
MDTSSKEALDEVVQSQVQVTTHGNAGAVPRVWQRDFRYARAQGRESTWQHLGAFAPVLAALGGSVILATWQRIQAVEQLVASDCDSSK